MASAVVNNVAVSPPSPAESFPWINPRISFSYDLADPPPGAPMEHRPEPDAAAEDFEFLLDNPVAMLPAEELFSGGKLVPLQMTPPKPAAEAEVEAEAEPPVTEIGPPEHPETRRKTESAPPDPYGFSPRAPRCTTRWRELLGLKRVRGPKPGVQVNAAAAAPAAAPAATSKMANSRSPVKFLLHRNLKPAASLDVSLSVPLLQGSDHEHMVIAASRLSLSSSPGPDQEDLARLSTDSDKPTHAAPRAVRTNPSAAAARARASRSPSCRAWSKQSTASPSPHGTSVDSPRMSSSGRIVFQGLERSSSSPGGFARPRRPRGVERSYSAHVRVTPVLNVVPVRSLRGSSKPVSVFGFSYLLSPQQRKDGAGSTTGRATLARPVRRQQRHEKDRDTAPKTI